MKKLIQLAVGLAVMFGVAPFTFGTPLNHWMVFVVVLVAAMYATAVAQFYWDHRVRR